MQEYRFFYDGSIKCFEGKHLIYMFISLLLIFIVVIPGPCIVALISYRHFNVRDDTITIVVLYVHNYDVLGIFLEDSSI